MQVWDSFHWEGCGPGEVQEVGIVVEALSHDILFVEPKQIDPSLILVATTNRDGAPPTAQHVHCGIARSFMTKGFDRTRLAIGICTKYTSEHGKALLMDRNKRLSKGNKLLPAINEEAMYGSLAHGYLV